MKGLEHINIFRSYQGCQASENFEVSNVNLHFFITANIYSQTEVKHRLDRFLEKQKIDKVVTIYCNVRYDYHKGKQPGMVNAHLSLKCPYSLAHDGVFQTLRHVKC